MRNLLELCDRKIATFMKDRGSLIDTTSAFANPLQYMRPSCLNLTPYNFPSASLSSSPTSSHCKSSACRPSHKISLPTVLQQFSNSYLYRLSHSPRMMKLPSVSPDSYLVPLNGPRHTRDLSYLLQYNELLIIRRALFISSI